MHASSAGRRPCGTKVMRFPMATPSRSYPLGGVGAVTTLPRCSPTRHKAPLSCLIPSSRVAASPSSERRSLRHPVACPSGRETRRRHPARADRFAADGSRFPARSHHSPLCSLASQPERPVRQGLLALWPVGAAKRKAALHACGQKRDRPARPVGYHANLLRSSSL